MPRYAVGGAWTDGPSLSYSDVTHAWWRIRSAGGNIVWETSADGVIWDNRWSVPHPFAVTAMTAEMICGFWGAESPATAFVDNFNVAAA
jgi:hypothetical protein